jgi:hypothetical protein
MVTSKKTVDHQIGTDHGVITETVKSWVHKSSARRP